MKKEEVLAKSKTGGMDEREIMIEKDSFGFALIVVLFMVFAFGGWKLIHGVKSYELISIATGYIAADSIYKYCKLHLKKYLIAGIFGALAAVAGAIAFFIGA